MRKIIIILYLLAFFGNVAFAKQSNKIICTTYGKNIRQFGGFKCNSSVYLTFLYKNMDDKATLGSMTGHISASYINSNSENYFDSTDLYYGSFTHDVISNNPNYIPRKYLEHYQFPLDATATNGNDGGGMWGNFILPKNPKKEFQAHYIFQAGDHMGGTVDMNCKIITP